MAVVLCIRIQIGKENYDHLRYPAITTALANKNPRIILKKALAPFDNLHLNFYKYSINGKDRFQ
jgi:hypothetical protein